MNALTVRFRLIGHVLLLSAAVFAAVQSFPQQAHADNYYAPPSANPPYGCPQYFGFDGRDGRPDPIHDYGGAASVLSMYFSGCGGACGIYDQNSDEFQTFYISCQPQQRPSCTSSTNTCGQTNTGVIQDNGSCSVGAPANPSYYGQGCTSAPNACGQTTTGTYNCSAVCSAVTPSNAGCNAAPNTPTFQFYDNATGAPTSWNASAYRSAGYRVYMSATDPNGDNVAIYYQFYNAQNGQYFQEGWATPTWTGSGGWEYANSLANYPPGTYYVRAYSYDTSAVTSAWSAWQPIVLSTPAPTGSCSAAPTSIYENGSVTWSANGVSGGNGSYTYAWGGTDGLTGPGASISKSYSTAGAKTASLTITSAGLSTTVSCSADANPGDGTVTVNSCRPTLSASPSTIDVGQSSNLNWSVAASCASSCTFSDGHTVTGQSGSYAVTPSAPSSGTTVTYAITCPATDASKTTQTDINVRVPVVTIAANPTRVKKSTDGTPNTTITWTASNVNSCSITRNGSAWSYNGVSFTNMAANASRQVNGTSPDAVTTQTTYTITCANNSATAAAASATFVVDVIPSFQEF